VLKDEREDLPLAETNLCEFDSIDPMAYEQRIGARGQRHDAMQTASAVLTPEFGPGDANSICRSLQDNVGQARRSVRFYGCIDTPTSIDSELRKDASIKNSTLCAERLKIPALLQLNGVYAARHKERQWRVRS
jgi:hypothetical protein